MSIAVLLSRVQQLASQPVTTNIPVADQDLMTEFRQSDRQVESDARLSLTPPGAGQQNRAPTTLKKGPDQVSPQSANLLGKFTIWLQHVPDRQR